MMPRCVKPCVTRYSRQVFEAIARDYCAGMLDVRDDGVWISASVVKDTPLQQSELQWTPAVELDELNAPDALVAPSLPIPFTANELAAFMLDGVGAGITLAYGPWDTGPDGAMIENIGMRGNKAREAIKAAYHAIREADGQTGALGGEQRRKTAATAANESRSALAKRIFPTTGCSPPFTSGLTVTDWPTSSP